MAICSLHAQAEACRFVLLYMQHKKDLNLPILVPIISGSGDLISAGKSCSLVF